MPHESGTSIHCQSAQYDLKAIEQYLTTDGTKYIYVYIYFQNSLIIHEAIIQSWVRN
jgi:hypothetical protein